MTTRFPDPPPGTHWSDAIRAEAAERWRRQHPLRTLLIRWRWTFQRHPVEAGAGAEEELDYFPEETKPHRLAPGEGRCPGLSERVLDEAETSRILRKWREHCSAVRRQRMAEALRRAQEQREREREGEREEWRKGKLSAARLKELRRKAAAEERRYWELRALAWLLERLLAPLSLNREMRTCWLTAPCTPLVFLTAGDGVEPGEDGPGCEGHYFSLTKISTWRQEPGGKRTLLSSRTMRSREARAIWRQRKALGWRAVPMPA